MSSSEIQIPKLDKFVENSTFKSNDIFTLNNMLFLIIAICIIAIASIVLSNIFDNSVQAFVIIVLIVVIVVSANYIKR